MVDLLLVMTLGFLGSFGHCVGMCGPLTAAFSLAKVQDKPPTPWQQFIFHVLLNMGRILSYALVGLAIGAVGSVVLAGGQLAGVGSLVRRLMALLTGGLLVWFGLVQIAPSLLPRVPLLHPLMAGRLHERLGRLMQRLGKRSHVATPLLLGAVWGLFPCGFLYAAQIKAADTGNPWLGSATMLAFGLGTLPTMLGVGTSAAWLSADQRSQFYRLGGWVTLSIGIVTLLRTGDTMTDFTGHASLLCLMLALVARPLSRLWGGLLRVRRALGVGAFILAAAHTLHMAEHTWGWNWQAIAFMLPQHQGAIAAGAVALLAMLPAALTSFDRAQKWLGETWRPLHLLSVPALLLATIHAIAIGSTYLGVSATGWHWAGAIALSGATLSVLLLRGRWVWKGFGQEEWYAESRSRRS
ncbi:sulfite exporter TauE/SafE family protein [Thermoleptolyngbya sp. C42_A2020_037]|uniref:urease accessory protein UreH domain-containing protein n=1 Tax=Thermoleptolyngbya sp. C42_A2020_037 TaxID=2747799 RepID=UPI001A03EB0F|nr:sulfite exporter TauE/SafE family protein [Thermoleptolyngbya sp. C42_A2020_037]MBF2083203.1 sulfite exporter TauE/SafE family protein [Thermoleptolyngbya sp. C42_A2020_037]